VNSLIIESYKIYLNRLFRRKVAGFCRQLNYVRIQEIKMQILGFRQDKTSPRYFVISTLLVLLLFIAPVATFAQDSASIDALRQMGRAFAEIAEKASPAVVGIKARQVVTQEYSTMPDWPFGDSFDDDFFERFFGRQFRSRPSPQQKSYRPVQGSGFIVSPDGYILTNNHVVKNADEITVKLAGGRDYEAKVIGTDPDTEIAVIKIDANNLAVLELADSDTLEVGEWVLAIGNPFGLSHTVTAGIVSAKGRSGLRFPGDAPEYQDFIQTDAAINPGNSGGPLINLDGEVVGINTAIIGPGGNIGIGFAIPINMAKFIYKQLVEGGTIVRGALGIVIRDLDHDLADSLGLEEDTKGVVVNEVIEGSAAEKAGMKRYDVVVEFNGGKVKKVNEFRNRVAILKPGTEVKIVVLRNGNRKTLTAELGDSSTQLQSFKISLETLERLGLVVQNLTNDLAERLGCEGQTGVVVTRVKPGSEAAYEGITAGMLIMEVDRMQVKNTKDFNKAIEKAGKAGQVLLLIYDGRYHHLVVLKLPKK
jgi:serine protease Do